jgi:hypothetical protein
MESVKQQQYLNHLVMKHAVFLSRLHKLKPELYGSLTHYIANYKDLLSNSDMAKHIDEVFTFLPQTTETITLYKGVSQESSILPTAGFVSVSRSKDVALAQGGALVVFNVPSGSTVLCVDSVSQTSASKQEVLIDRNSKFIVTLIERGTNQTPDTFNIVCLPPDTVTMKSFELGVLTQD